MVLPIKGHFGLIGLLVPSTLAVPDGLNGFGTAPLRITPFSQTPSPVSVAIPPSLACRVVRGVEYPSPSRTKPGGELRKTKVETRPKLMQNPNYVGETDPRALGQG